jgi:hypothetical protein
MECNVFAWMMTTKFNGLTLIDQFLMSSDALMVRSSKSLHGFRVALKRCDTVPVTRVYVKVDLKRYHEKYKPPKCVPISKFDWKCFGSFFGEEGSAEDCWCISANLEYQEHVDTTFMLADNDYFEEPDESEDSPYVSTQSDDFFPFAEKSDDDWDYWGSETDDLGEYRRYQ